MTPKRLFSIFAIGEAITWALLILGMILKYGTRTTDVLVSIGGGLHGFMFLAFLVVTLLVGISQAWRPWVTLLGLASAVLPFTTIPFDVWASRTGKLDGPWQLAPGGRAPRGGVEKAVRWAFGHVWLTAGVLAAFVVVVFTTLVVVGPPGS